MVKNKHVFRSLIAFLVTWSFVILTVTGIVLYIVPHGRVAYWTIWSLMGLEKDQWANIHMMFGGVFIVTGALHLYFNWKPFRKYLAEKVKGHLEFTREVYVSLAITGLILALSVLNLPPVSWVFDLNETVKTAWVTEPGLEPPFGHAEEVSLSGLARRMDIDLAKAMAELKAQGVEVADKRETIKQIALNNGITPMGVYAHIRRFEKQMPAGDISQLTPGEVEAKFAGKGLGRKTLAGVMAELKLDQKAGLARLTSKGIKGEGEEKLRKIADAHDITPLELLKMLLIDGYRP